MLQIRSYFLNWVESNWLNLQNSSWSCLKKVTCLMTWLTYMFSISVSEFSNLIEICLQPCEVVKSAQLGLSNTYKKCTSHVLEPCCKPYSMRRTGIDTYIHRICSLQGPQGCFKLHIFWEGHIILQNLHLTFVLYSASQK